MVLLESMVYDRSCRTLGFDFRNVCGFLLRGGERAGCMAIYGGTAPKFCMFHKRGFFPLSPVEHTKLRSCTSVCLFVVRKIGQRLFRKCFLKEIRRK